MSPTPVPVVDDWVDSSRAARRRVRLRRTAVLRAGEATNALRQVLAGMLGGAPAPIDKEKQSWCDNERTQNHADLKSKKGDILRLDGKIDLLEKTMGGSHSERSKIRYLESFKVSSFKLV